MRGFSSSLLAYFSSGTSTGGLQCQTSECGQYPDGLSSTALDEILLSVPSVDKIREWAGYYTSTSHFVGEGLPQAQYTKDLWDQFGIPQTNIKSYSMDLTYPDQHRVALLDLENSPQHLQYEAPLKEVGAAQPKDVEKPFMPAFLVWAGKGNVTAQYVYANFGLKEDYEDLVQRNVTLKGMIAVIKTTFGSAVLAKYNLTAHRTEQMTDAFKYGIAGLLIYPDPQLDGDITEANGYKPFPDGPARPPSMIERGEISDAGPDSDHAIPAVPISYADAAPILRALNGHGPLADDINGRWQGGGLGYRDVQYNVGPSPGNVVVNIVNFPKRWTGPVHNVIGTIPGHEFPDEVIIIGNHRDAYGPGSGDAVSGSAALNEVARSFGTALSKGWQPRRTIILGSWEGEEAGWVGSTAWIEENLARVNRTAAAYLNVVVAGAGSKLRVAGSQVFKKALHEAMAKVPAPGVRSREATTLLDAWGDNIASSSGGDAIPFISHTTVSALDFGYITGPDELLFPYHSQFDCEAWLDRYGDPDRQRALATTRLWAILTASLADEPLLPYRIHDYVPTLRDGVVSALSTEGVASNLNFTQLDAAISRFDEASARFDAESDSYSGRVAEKGSDSSLSLKIQDINRKLTQFERQLGDVDVPVSGRQAGSRHLIVSSTPFYFTANPYPFLRDAIRDRNWTEAQLAVTKIADQLDRASLYLQ